MSAATLELAEVDGRNERSAQASSCAECNGTRYVCSACRLACDDCTCRGLPGERPDREPCAACDEAPTLARSTTPRATACRACPAPVAAPQPPAQPAASPPTPSGRVVRLTMPAGTIVELPVERVARVWPATMDQVVAGAYCVAELVDGNRIPCREPAGRLVAAIGPRPTPGRDAQVPPPATHAPTTTPTSTETPAQRRRAIFAYLKRRR